MNCALDDDGIELVKNCLSKLEQIQTGKHFEEYWQTELQLMLSMLYYYNLEYKNANELHQKIAIKADNLKYLYVIIFNYSSWLRVSAFLNDSIKFEETYSTLKSLLRQDYDKRFALRTHSYRSLLYIRSNELSKAATELSLAKSVGKMNHEDLNTAIISVFVLVHTYKMNEYNKALNTAQQYIIKLQKESFLQLLYD